MLAIRKVGLYAADLLAVLVLVVVVLMMTCVSAARAAEPSPKPVAVALALAAAKPAEQAPRPADVKKERQVAAALALACPCQDGCGHGCPPDTATRKRLDELEKTVAGLLARPACPPPAQMPVDDEVRYTALVAKVTAGTPVQIAVGQPPGTASVHESFPSGFKGLRDGVHNCYRDAAGQLCVQHVDGRPSLIASFARSAPPVVIPPPIYLPPAAPSCPNGQCPYQQ